YANCLIGVPVRNSSGEALGHIKELIVDPVSGRVDFAIIALESLVGTEDRLIAVPWNALGIPSGRDYVLLEMEKIALERAPSFATREWPDFNNPVARSRIYKYYGLPEPAAVPSQIVVEHREYPAPRKEMSVLGVTFLVLVFV